jgi:hypothetical protein
LCGADEEFISDMLIEELHIYSDDESNLKTEGETASDGSRKNLRKLQ